MKKMFPKKRLSTGKLRVSKGKKAFPKSPKEPGIISNTFSCYRLLIGGLGFFLHLVREDSREFTSFAPEVLGRHCEPSKWSPKAVPSTFQYFSLMNSQGSPNMV